MIKRLLFFSIILPVILACGSTALSAPPTTDPCLALHTIGLPQCAPPELSSPNLEAPAPRSTSQPAATAEAQSGNEINILVDDFAPQPYQGETIYFYNRLEGDRGPLNDSDVIWGMGQVKTVVPNGNNWGGIWMSLNHPIREKQSVNFSAVLPPQILPADQSRITALQISIQDGTPGKAFRAELKDSNNNLQWSSEITLQGGRQMMEVDLPPLGEISQLVLVLDRASNEDFASIDRISFTATTAISDTAMAAFTWSYGMLLSNWNPDTGLVRDKAKDASGEFDAIQATGSLAAATAFAEQIGIINHADAVAIVSRIGDTLLKQLPRNHGLWPHWVRLATNGSFEIVPGTEWSSVDTVIAAIGLLDAQQALKLDTTATEKVLKDIDWKNLSSNKGISHGYTYDDILIPYNWDVFGSESWLVELAYASATGNVSSLAYPSAPTANGSGFIDELAWLYIQPPKNPDYWETDWTAYRSESAEKQMGYYVSLAEPPCMARFGQFGLSAAEVPTPSQVPKESICQAFGIGGQFAPINDGTPLLSSPVVTPHYSGMVASLQPEASIKMWDWLIAHGYFSPLNNVESLTFPPNSDCDPSHAEWNQLKGSWNLALQTLGWGRYLAERNGEIPIVWKASVENPFLKSGYQILAPYE